MLEGTNGKENLVPKIVIDLTLVAQRLQGEPIKRRMQTGRGWAQKERPRRHGTRSQESGFSAC